MNCSHALLSLFLLSPCGDDEGGTAARFTAPGSPVAAAVASAERPASDRERDAGRQPGQVLGFFGLTPGMRVLEVFAGGGYYSEILSHLVGPGGEVLAHNNEAYLGFARAELDARFTPGRLENVTRVTAELDDLALEPGSLDAALLILTWHDFYFADDRYGWPDVDEAALVGKLCDALKPGAVLGVVDHVAETGGDTAEVARTVHRVDPARVLADFEGSCFTLEARSDLLANAADDRSVSAIDPALRGQTDRFVYRFRKA
jgi:predicted methyltransferase